MTDGPLLLRVPEVVRLLQLGRDRVYGLVRDGQLASVRVGRSVRVPRWAVEEWVRRAAEAGER